MPVPIQYIPDNKRDKSISMDYSFLFNNPLPQRKTVTASDKDASLLFELWDSGEKVEEDTIKIAEGHITSQDILRLKFMGFLVGDTSIVKFTRKGKLIITTMALGEPNRFEQKREKKSYNEILASMSKKGKKGFRIAVSDPQFSTNNNNKLDLR